MIDLRSDTVTQPSAEMRKAMASAEVGDDVYGEDPSVNILQETVADMLGKEAALFVPSGTMGNQICLRVLTNPGDEVICDVGSHFLHFEGGALPILSGIQPKTISGHRGLITIEQIQRAIRPETYYFPRSKVVALENTHNLAGGTILPIDEIECITSFCRKNDLYMHLDGARLWNASVVTGIPLAKYAEHFDSACVSLSKGLGAPAGSVIVGNKAFIEEARHVRKQFGGGMRQIGILAAAGLFAIKNNFDRLAADHANAKIFAEIVSASDSVRIDLESVQTNIVVIEIHTSFSAIQIIDALKKRGALLSIMDSETLRAVTHLDVTQKDVIDAAHIVLDLLSL